MKFFFIIVFLSWSYWIFSEEIEQVLAGPQCTIDNYRDFVFQDNEKSPRCNLRGANLRRANLRHANLLEADLIEANLRHADLHNAELQYADLIKAKLQGADLQYANLEKANLILANLQGADLRKANLRHANLYDYFDRKKQPNFTGAKVTFAQAKYLKSQGVGGFEIIAVGL